MDDFMDLNKTMSLWSRELLRIVNTDKYKYLKDDLNFLFHCYDGRISVSLQYKDDMILSIVSITKYMTLIDDVEDMIFIPLLDRLSSKWGYATWD